MTLRGNADIRELVGRTPVGRAPRKRSREICVQVCLNTTQLSLRISPQQARLEAAARVISCIYLCGQEVSLEGSSLSAPEAERRVTWGTALGKVTVDTQQSWKQGSAMGQMLPIHNSSWTTRPSGVFSIDPKCYKPNPVYTNSNILPGPFGMD